MSVHFTKEPSNSTSLAPQSFIISARAAGSKGNKPRELSQNFTEMSVQDHFGTSGPQQLDSHASRSIADRGVFMISPVRIMFNHVPVYPTSNQTTDCLKYAFRLPRRSSSPYPPATCVPGAVYQIVTSNEQW